MATNDIGRVTPIWRGTYSEHTAYELNDIVIDGNGSVWWHKGTEITTGTSPAEGTVWGAVIDMSVFGAALQAAIETAQQAVRDAQAAESGVAADVQRAETAAGNAETYAQNAQTAATNAGTDAQAAAGSASAAAGSASAASGSASAASGSASAAAGSESDAEAYATGKRGGEDVGSSDPAYHNNAAYYADEAGTSAAAAEASADAAAQAVLTGNLAVTFDATAAYPAGAHVLYNGTLYVFTADHAAGAWTGTDVSAVKVGPEITHLKEAFAQLENTVLYTDNAGFDSDAIVVGENINTTTGTQNTNTKRSRTKLLPKKRFVIVESATYEYQVLSYDSSGKISDGTGYQGKLTDTWSKRFALRIPDTTVYIALIVKRTDDADMSSSDTAGIISGVTFYNFVDESLTKSGVPADAKRIGDVLSNMTGNTRNIFDVSLINASDITNNNGVLSGLASAFTSAYGDGLPIDYTFESNTQYTLSFYAYGSGSTTTGNGLRFIVKYTDNTQNIKNIPNNTSSYTKFTYTSAANKTISEITMGVGSGTGNTWYLKEIQIEKGTKATGYVPFKTPIDYVARDAVQELSYDSKEFPLSKFYTSNDDVTLVDTYSGVIALYDALLTAYPDYVTKNTLTSGSLTNYEYVLTFGNYNAKTAYRNKDSEIDKPVVLICSGVHGYERSSVMSLYAFVRALCEQRYTLADIIDYVTFKIIPIVCPYGYDHDSRLNESGVNINRNFDTTDWELTSVGDNYSGSAAGDQDETKIVQNWIGANADAVFLLDWHNSQYTAELSCLLGDNTTDATAFKKAYLLAINKIVPFWNKARGIDNNNLYAYSATSNATGTCKTYANEHGILGFTFETSWNVNDTGKDGAITIGVGCEAIANLLIGLKSYYGI